jgi:hypothetical protein
MILSSDELAILEYLKSWNGTSVSMVEICRCAGGRRKFRETPNWAKGMMARLVEANLIEVNERGHYRSIVEEEEPKTPKAGPGPTPKELPARTVGENYFPAGDNAGVVGEDYFPATSQTAGETGFWVSPQMAEILKKAGKKLGGKAG